jgi:hypothetical protein
MSEKEEPFTANITLCGHMNTVQELKWTLNVSPVMQYEFDDMRYTLTKVRPLKL